MSSTNTAAPASGRRVSARKKAPAMTAATSRLPSGRPKAPPAVIGLGLLLTLGCGAGAGLLMASSDEAITVVAAARDIPAGSLITAADLRSAQLAGSGLAAVPGERAGSLIGKRTTGPVPAGTLLNAGMVSETPAPAPGPIAVGLALEAGQLPVEQTAPGRDVELYQLAEPAAVEGEGGQGEPGRVLVAKALVLSVTPGTGGGVLLTVQVPADVAPAVSAASSAKTVAVGLLPLGTR